MQEIASFGEACEDRGDTAAERQIVAQKTGGEAQMSNEFVHTGQTFTGRGDAYCPLERKRRGPAALGAALTVLIAGGAFLVFSAASTPTRLPEAPIAAALPVSEEKAAQIVNQTQTVNAAATKRTGAEESVEAVLAESRAARTPLTLAGAEPPLQQGLTPRIKPSAAVKISAEVKGVIETEGVAPSLKPEAPTPPPVSLMQVAKIQYASFEEGPPPIFFANDLVRKDVVRISPAVVFAADLAQEPEEIRVRLSRGENFVEALKRAGVSPEDANAAAYAFGKHQDLRRLLPGQEFALTVGWPNQTLFEMAAQHNAPDARLLGLEFRADAENRILMKRVNGGKMVAEKKTVPLTTRIMSIAGRINGSLYMSAKHVGAPDEVIANLADAFSYDVDFQREIFGGDEFEAIFEVKYDDQGKLVSAGDILFARLNWRGRSREKGYYRFLGDDGRPDYYDAAGQSAKRLLMKTPIDGARLSSGFGTRKHPILGYRRAHKGVDFAAPRGTPVKAAGDGVIERANRYGSFGNYVKIRHANGYETAYAHLNGFARGMRAGKRVRQGDIIAYVGTTGRSTGPHLHYEVHLRGTAVNPQRLKIDTTGKTLEGAALAKFKEEKARIDAMRMPEETREALYARDERNAQGAL